MAAPLTELRKVHESSDGRLERTDRVAPELSTSLSAEPIPDEAVIDDQREFHTSPLSAVDFEAIWRRADDAR